MYLITLNLHNIVLPTKKNFNNEITLKHCSALSNFKEKRYINICYYYYHNYLHQIGSFLLYIKAHLCCEMLYLIFILTFINLISNNILCLKYEVLMDNKTVTA